MLFHIQATHSYETRLAKDPEKKKILRDALKSAEQKCLNLYEQLQTQSLTRLWRYLRVDNSTIPCLVSGSRGITVSHQNPNNSFFFG